MFVIPSIVTLAAGLALAGFLGWSAFVGWQNSIKTRADAEDFLLDLLGVFVGFCAVITSVHSMVA